MCGWLVAQILAMAGYAAWFTIAGRPIPSVDDMEMSGSLLAAAVILCIPPVVGLSVLFARIRNGPSVRDYLGLHWPSASQNLLWTLALVALAVASDLITVALKRPIVPEVMVELYHNTELLPLLWVGLVVAAPVTEEIFFRGFFFHGLAQSRLGGAGTVLLTAALWAVIHLQYDAYGIGMIFVAGILMGLVRLKTNSVLLCMVLHALMNLWATIEIEIFFPLN